VESDIDITIPDVGVKAFKIPNIFVDNYEVDPPHIYVPVTVEIGKPIINVPGCVEAHELNKTQEGGTKNKQLAKDDDTVTFCDAGTPSFNAMDYTPEQLIINREIEPPPVEPPPDPPISPEVDPPQIPDTETECPGPTQLRVGDLTQSGDEIVVGHELQGTVCVTLYEPTTPAEKFLPSMNQASTTAAIAIVATASAAATPLLLRLIKPTIKKLMTTVQKKFGSHRELSMTEKRANEYRSKKGLPPLKFQSKKSLKK
tara:strand:- start:224 stop:994 length:771 start_codon:yes stop_codon:yes gene_type:complete